MSYSKIYLLTAILLLNLNGLSTQTAFAASGDMLPPLEGEKNVTTTYPILIDNTLLSFQLPETVQTEQQARDFLGKVTLKLNNDKDTIKFSLPTEKYTLQQQSFFLFYGHTVPVESNNGKSFPTVTRYVATLPKYELINSLQTQVVEKINRPKQDVTIKQEHGKIIFEGTAENGRQVDVNGLIKGMVFAIENGINNIDIPAVEETGQVFTENLEGLNVKELISTGVSDFSGSPANRIHNIKTGIQRFNGVVIKQGANFSFNDQLGPVDASTGFLPELVIKGPDTIPEFGGGLCQTSTTAFRAALFAGLPILERRNHSYAVSYYAWPLGWGFDATIYIGAVDLKFKNDTPGDILIQTYTEGTRVYYKFYGIKDTRRVVVGNSVVTGYRSAPPPITVETSSLPPGVKKLKEHAHTGLSAYFTRSVEYPDGKEMNDKFVSVYQARPLVYLVGSSGAPGDTDVFYTGDITGEP